MSTAEPPSAVRTRRVPLLGATGTVGRATAAELVRRGYDVVCFMRLQGVRTAVHAADRRLPDGATLPFGTFEDPGALLLSASCGEHFDIVVSCLASRTGAPRNA